MNAINAIKLNFNEYVNLNAIINKSFSQKLKYYKETNNINILKPYECFFNYHLESKDYKFIALELQLNYSVIEKYEFNCNLYEYIFINYFKKTLQTIFIPDILNTILDYFHLGLDFEMIKNAQMIGLIKNTPNDIYICWKGDKKDNVLFDEIIKLTKKEPKTYLIQYDIYKVSTQNYEGTKIIDNIKSYCENCKKEYDQDSNIILN